MTRRLETDKTLPYNHRFSIQQLVLIIVATCSLVAFISVASRMVVLGLSAVTTRSSAVYAQGNDGLVGRIPPRPLAIIRNSQAAGPLRVHPTNPRYFTDGSGKAILLTGSHTWSNFQDSGGPDPPPIFDYNDYLDFLQQHNHNFIRLWVWEEAKGAPWTTDDYWFRPLPYLRSGPGTALDGKPKFDLTQFNQAYFDRLRQHVVEANQRGIYVSIMLFDGWSVADQVGAGNPWVGHPFNASNNINGINGDPNNDGNGREIHTLQIQSVTNLQEAYVRKVIDTVNDLDNVLYEISNESTRSSRDWQYHMINYIKSYEAGQPQQHPVGMTKTWPDGDNSDLFASPADWISPDGSVHEPEPADGSKVILSDTDHLCGICGDRIWAWKSFTRGQNPLFMDGYDGAAYGLGAPYDWDPNDPTWVSLRLNLGYILTYANRVNLAAMTPRGDLASTDYCLANPAASGGEYLVYLPSGGSVTVDLSASPGEFFVEWFNPSNGTRIGGGRVTGGSIRSFTPPFGGDAVLLLRDTSLFDEKVYLPVVLRN